MTPRMKLWVAASRGAAPLCCSTPDGLLGLVLSESAAVGSRPGLIMKALHPVAPAPRCRRAPAPEPNSVPHSISERDLGLLVVRKTDVGSSANFFHYMA